MSHFTSVRTKIVERKHLLKALTDMGYDVEQGKVEVRGYAGSRTSAEVKVATGSAGYEIGFRLHNGAYDMVADWWGIRNIQPEAFLSELMRRYARSVTASKLEEQGFSIIAEDTEEGGRVHMVLRRMI